MAKREDNTFRIQTLRKWRNSICAIKSSEYQDIVNQYSISEKQKKEIVNFFVSNYGKKISYDCHRYYAAHSGVMNPQYFPDFLLWTYFERFMNYDLKYNRVYEDKGVFPYVAKEAGVKIPETFAKKVCGVFV